MCPFAICPFSIPPTSCLECRHDGWSSSSLEEVSLWIKAWTTKDGRAKIKEACIHEHYETTIPAWDCPPPDFFYVKENSISCLCYYSFCFLLYAAEPKISYG